MFHHLLIALSQIALADTPPPLPPNPFSNLPSEANPFDEEFDDEGFDDWEDAPPPPSGGARSSGGGASSSPSMSPPPPRSGGGSGVTIGSPRTRPGTSSASDVPAVSKYEPANAKDIVDNFDYPDAEILDVAKAISKLTGKNFIYNPGDVKGKISVVSETPITVGDAWNAFLTALNMRGFALVPSGKYLRIERVGTAKEKQTTIYSEKRPPDNDEFITKVIPLRYIDAAEFEQAFRLWIPRDARMQAYSQTNTLIITDTASHIKTVLDLIKLLDVAGYQESLVVVPIKNAAAKDIAKLIEQIIREGATGGSNFGGSYGGPPRPAPNYGGIGRSTRGRSGGSVISKIIADDRTNTLIVKANAVGVQEIRALVRRLDTKVAANAGSGRIHVIQLRYTDAEQLAKTLTTITASSGQGNRPRSFPMPGMPGENAAVFQGDIKVSADKTTQSLVIAASPQDFTTFRKVVEALDIPRDQVYIEALLLEMNLNKDNSFGSSFVSAPNGIALPSASGALTNILAGNPIPNGFTLGFKSGPERAGITAGTGDNAKTFKTNGLNGIFEMVKGNSDANVIATPQIIALDNEEATIEISETIMVPQSTTAANGSTSETFSPDKAELTLKVKPQINKASNFVKLEIQQKLENFDSANVPQQLQGRTKGKNSRITNTKAIVQNEDTVVLSGLMRDSTEEIVKKVPLLGDIPILGWLFKNSQTTVKKTNLLVFITPRIIKQYDAVRKILNNKLEERAEFARDNVGSRDPLAKRVDKIRQSLPDLTVIEPLPRSQPLSSQSFSMPSQSDDNSESDGPDYGYNDYYPGDSYPIQPFDGQFNSTQPDFAPPPPVDNSNPPPVIPGE